MKTKEKMKTNEMVATMVMTTQATIAATAGALTIKGIAGAVATSLS